MKYVYQLSNDRNLRCLALILALLTALSGAAWGQSATNIDVSSSVLQSNVVRLGINLGDQTYYDSGQMMKNLVFRNPGFEGEVYRSILTCGSFTTNSCTDNNQYSPQPTGFWTGGTYQVLSGTSAGATGNIVSSTKASSCSGCGQLVTFDKSLSLAKNDYVVVRTTIPGNAQAGWWTGTSGGGTLTTDTTDLSSESPGKQAMSLNASGTGQTAGVTSWFDSWNGLSFIQLNGTFQLTFRAKGNGGSNSLQVQVARLMTGLGNYVNVTVPLTTSWKDYTYTFTASENGSAIGPVEANFTASGSNVLLDDVSLVQTDSDPTNTTAFRDDVVNALKSLQPGVIRMMGSEAELGAEIADQLAVPFARYREGFSTGSQETDDIPYGIHELLQLCALVGADPWITIPTATTPAEMTELIEYMTGNGSDPYSALRIARGQTAPWTTVFNKIHIELGNEVWNGVFGGETMTYPPYPLWANQVFGAARATSGYESSKFDLVISGIAATPGYNQLVLGYSTQHDTVDIAPYLLYSANNDTMTGLFQSLFAEPEMYETTGEVYKNVVMAAGLSTPTKVAVYETNLGTVLGSITQSELNQLTPSVGAGVAVADHMFQMMRLGIAYQNMFTLPQYEFGRSDGSTVRLWGSVVDMGTTNRRRPQFISETLANTAIFGDMLTTTQSGANPTWNEPLSSDSVQLSGAHEIQSFAFTDGTKSSAVLFNLTVGTSLPVTFTGANAPSGTVQMSRLTSANITDTNETSSTVATTTSTLSSFSASSGLTLPPFSMTVLTWGGGTETQTPTAATPVFSVAAGTYSATQTVSISDATSGAAIYYTTNGTTPTTSSTKYTGPITVSSTSTLEAIAVASGYNNSSVASSLYTIAKTVATPVFSLATGSFTSALSVGITDATAGATIYYTTDGSTPTTSSTKYTGSISILQTLTLKAIGVLNGYTTSSVASALYTILGSGGQSTVTATPVISPATGTYSAAQTVGIADTTSGAKIYYTTDGSTPTTSSTLYTGSFSADVPGTVKAIAIASGDTQSSVATATYTAAGLATPTFSPAPGTYTTAQKVTITDSSAGVAIFYTTNGTTPTTSSTKYTGPITISSSMTLEAIAVYSTDPSTVAKGTYVISPAGKTVINYASGFSPSKMSLNVDAQWSGTALQLTKNSTGQIGTAWYTTPVSTTAFTTDFTFKATSAVADGFTFAIQNNSKGIWAFGGNAGGLGFEGMSRSVGLKFDMYATGSSNTNTTGVYLYGANPAGSGTDMTSSGINLHSGDTFHAHVVYASNVLTLTLTDTKTGKSFSKAYSVNIASAVNGTTAYVGFTGSTGSRTATQQILTWTVSTP